MSKTKQKILDTSLNLFNLEGESNVTPVDIANELDISPGNLYYHYKGKDPIIAALYDDYVEEMTMVLNAPIEKPLMLSDNWVFFYILFEEIMDFRFFFQNLQSLLERYPDINKKFQRLMIKTRSTLTHVINTLYNNDFIEISDSEIERLAENWTMQLIFWPTYQPMMMPDLTPAQSIHKAVFNMFSQVSPYVIDGREEFEALLNKFYERKV